MRHQLKFNVVNEKKPPQKHSVIVDSTLGGDDIVGENIEVIIERLPGKKAEKERERKRKGREALDSKFHAALTWMRKDRIMCMVERIQVASSVNSDRS